MVLTFPLKSVGSWESCYAFNPGPEFQKMLIFFPSLGSFSSAGDKKLSLLSLIVEKPEHPQCRDSSVCTTVLYFTIVKSLLILFRTCSYSSMEKKKKSLFLANEFLPYLHHPFWNMHWAAHGCQKKSFTGPSQAIILFIKLICLGMVVNAETGSHGRVSIFLSRKPLATRRMQLFAKCWLWIVPRPVTSKPQCGAAFIGIG